MNCEADAAVALGRNMERDREAACIAGWPGGKDNVRQPVAHMTGKIRVGVQEVGDTQQPSSKHHSNSLTGLHV